MISVTIPKPKALAKEAIGSALYRTGPSKLTAPPKKVRTVREWACLLLSSNPSRLAQFVTAAKKAGWEPESCTSLADAVKAHQRENNRLVAIDFSSMPAAEKSAFQSFGEQVRDADRLLLVSDQAGEPESEIWARQSGAWLYLADPDLGVPLTELFGEAMKVAEKLSGGQLTGSNRPSPVV